MRATRRRNIGNDLAAGILAASLSIALADRAQAQCMYEVVAEVKNPTCTQGSGNATITAINDLNVAVGYYAHNCGFDMRPIMWSQETGAVPIPLPPGVSQAFAYDVNSHGEIVGALTRTGVGQRAFRYRDGVWTELPPTGSGTGSRANAINDDGWVVGYRDTDDGIVAFRWRGDVVEELSSQIRDEGARADDVNSHQAVTGTFGSLIFGRAFKWHIHRTTIIPPLEGGTSSVSTAINNQPVISGYSYIKIREGDVPIRSWIFENSKLTDLGALPEASHRTSAEDINDAGQIVGRSQGEANGTARPFLWQHGQIHDLEALIVNPPPNNNLSTASAINNHGWIAVDGVLLRPIDRPLGDVNIDCVIDERDLIAVLEGWGPDRLGHFADIVTSSNLQPPGDGKVDGADLAVVLGNWSFSTEASAPERSR